MNDLLEKFQTFQKVIQVEELPLPLDPNAPLAEENPSMDVFSLMGEWTALKKELKTQNKIQHNTQVSLEKALQEIETFHQKLENESQTHDSELESMRTSLTNTFEEQNKAQLKQFLTSLLPTLDSLDYAITHWEESRDIHRQQSPPWFGKTTFEELGNVFSGGLEGLLRVREKFWECLEQYHFVPQMPLGEAFNPATMMAVGNHPVESDSDANKVHKLQLRGYIWHGQVFRPSEVIVTSKMS